MKGRGRREGESGEREEPFRKLVRPALVTLSLQFLPKILLHYLFLSAALHSVNCNVSVRPHATQASKGFQELAFLTLRYRSFSKGRWRKVGKHALGFSQVKGENSLRCVMKVYLVHDPAGQL